jgi:hypothetical protein
MLAVMKAEWLSSALPQPSHCRKKVQSRLPMYKGKTVVFDHISIIIDMCNYEKSFHLP